MTVAHQEPGADVVERQFGSGGKARSNRCQRRVYWVSKRAVKCAKKRERGPEPTLSL